MYSSVRNRGYIVAGWHLYLFKFTNYVFSFVLIKLYIKKINKGNLFCSLIVRKTVKSPNGKIL